MFKTKILLIEDNFMDVELITRMISKCDNLLASVHHIALLGEAKKYLMENFGDVDLILLDLNLPDSDYRNTLHTIVSNFERIPIIVFSQMNTRIGLHAVEMGAEDYLNKNDLTQELLEKTILFALKRKQHRNAMKLLDQMDPQTNTLREDAFNNMVTRCAQVRSPDEPFHTITIQFENIVSLPINTNIIEFIRGFNYYIENIMSNALLATCYIGKHQMLKILVQTSQPINTDRLTQFSKKYIHSAINRNLPIDIIHHAINPIEGSGHH